MLEKAPRRSRGSPSACTTRRGASFARDDLPRITLPRTLLNKSSELLFRAFFLALTTRLPQPPPPHDAVGYNSSLHFLLPEGALWKGVSCSSKMTPPSGKSSLA